MGNHELVINDMKVLDEYNRFEAFQTSEYK